MYNKIIENVEELEHKLTRLRQVPAGDGEMLLGDCEEIFSSALSLFEKALAYYKDDFTWEDFWADKKPPWIK